MYNAAHHANEWITAVILARFAEDCAREVLPAWESWVDGNQPGEARNPGVPEMQSPWYEQVTLHMVPMVNPDGVDMVAGGRRATYTEAHNCGANVCGDNNMHDSGKKSMHMHDDWKANACGVDLNSNYPAGWDLAKTHKYARGYTAPGPRDYVGPYPLSEPESLAMAAYTKLINPAMTLSLHTQGEVIYWRYRDYMPSGAAELAKLLSAASGYELADVPDESSHGGYRDWFIEEFNRPGFTIECGLGENPLPISDFDGIYRRVRPLMMEALCYDIIE